MINSMKIIRIPTDLKEVDFLNLSQEWDQVIDGYVDMSGIKELKHFIHCAEIALAWPNKKLSFAILEYVAEQEEIPVGILKLILKVGDQGCREAVCLRNNLDDELILLCKELDLVHQKLS